MLSSALLQLPAMLALAACALLPACAEEAAAEEVGEEHTGRTQVDTTAEPQQGVLARSRL